jgi:Fe-S-cluster containining protein
MGHPRFWRADRGAAGDPRWLDVPQQLQEELQSYIDNMEEMDLGQPCLWYDPQTRQCRHYEYRPQICRDFEAGNFHCLRMRFDQGIVDEFGK